MAGRSRGAKTHIGSRNGSIGCNSWPGAIGRVTEAVRRQFNVSLALIAALAFGIGVVAYSMRSAPKRPVTAAIEHVEPNSPIFGALVKP